MADWHITHRRARKVHRCKMCGRAITPGEVYLHGVGFEGTAWSWKECAHCEAVRGLYDIDRDGEYNFDYYASWADETQTIAELRHAAGWHMRWRTRMGALLPVPESQDSGSAG